MDYFSTGFISNSRFTGTEGVQNSSIVYIGEEVTMLMKNVDFVGNGNAKKWGSKDFAFFRCSGGNISVSNATVSNNTGVMMLREPCPMQIW